MRALVYSTGIVQNEMIWIRMPTYCILQVHSVHTHTHTCIPFEDREPTGAKSGLLTLDSSSHKVCQPSRRHFSNLCDICNYKVVKAVTDTLDNHCNWLDTQLSMDTITRAQELCESQGGHPGLPSLISLRFLWT